MRKLQSFLMGGACIALTSCTLMSPEQPNASAQPPAEIQQPGAVFFLEQARELVEQKHFDQAAELCENTIRDFPAETGAYEYLIQIQIELKQFEAAKKTTQRYATRFPDSLPPILLRAAIYSQQNLLAEAERIYRDGLNQFPESEELLLGLALTLARQKRPDEAANLLDPKLESSDHWSATIYAFRAQIALMSEAEKPEEKKQSLRAAISFLDIATEKAPERPELWLRKSELERAVKDFPAATRSLEKLQTLNPENPKLSQTLAVLYLQQNDYENTRRQIELLLNKHQKEAAEVVDLATRHALATGNAAEATRLSSEAARALPDDMDTQFLHGYTLIHTRQFPAAESALAASRTKQYRDQPNSFDPRLELYYGIALLQQQKTAEAAEVFIELAAQQFDANIADYLQLLRHWQDTETIGLLAGILEQAEQEITDSIYLPYFRALILQQQQKYKPALQAFISAEERAIARNEQEPDFLNDNFYYQFASSYERCGRIKEAEELFRKTIGINPKRADAMNYLAYMWAEHQQHLAEAQELITKALELNPNTGAFIDTLGWIYYQQEKHEQAMEQLLKAAELEPLDPSILDHLGDCSLKLGMPAQARKHWLKSLELHPNETIGAKLDAIPTE